MPKSHTFYIRFLILFFVIGYFIIYLSQPQAENKRVTWWATQSIDTVKYSRDIAREKLKDNSFNPVIDLQVKNIALTGATHIAIGTPYDEEFLPFLKRWVVAARKYGLNVWFRGNFSGWEKWFDYSSINRAEHIRKTRDFILKNKDIFLDGDIFTPCPECENGGPGDPRQTGDIDGYRKFLIEEYKVTKDAFKKIDKNVTSNYDSMNGDVARVVMDKETTRALDGIVTVDHYVASVDKLIKDIQDFAKTSGGKIVLGEYGAPIIDLHGDMTPKQQKDYLNTAFLRLAKTPELIGINYWVNEGGSTKLWEDGKPREAVGTITAYYAPKSVSGIVKNEIGQVLTGTLIQTSYRKSSADNKGRFQLTVLPDDTSVKVSASGYYPKKLPVVQDNSGMQIVLVKQNEGFFFKLSKFFHQLFK